MKKFTHKIFEAEEDTHYEVSFNVKLDIKALNEGEALFKAEELLKNIDNIQESDVVKVSKKSPMEQ